MHPFTILFLIFLTVPLVEIYILIKVGGIIGAPLTVFFVVFTAVLGAWLLRLQGFATLRRIQQTLHEGGLPAVELLEGAVLLIAGALLLTPGFFTDAVGFACLVPAVRRVLITRAMKRMFKQGQQRANSFHQQTQEQPDQPHRPKVIEGEYTREDD